MAKKVNELRSLSAGELKAKVGELRAALFDLRMKLKTGRLDSTATLKDTKRELARVHTVLREQELGIQRTIATE
ncbi:MAG TPA: 50S ribosomal protein L29 [Vulgatibacter sp.]|nr:50S ribosomal protein L29 [Vulgatibacter sp.]